METEPTQVLMIMLCHRCALGGAEKRYARVFELLTSLTDGDHKLLINRAMLELLNSANILADHDEYVIVLDPPSVRYRIIKKVPGLHTVVDSIWYSIRCLQIILKHPSAVTHPLLTAVHYCLPIFLCSRKRRLMMSAYSYQFQNYRERTILGIPIAATMKRLMMQHANRIDALSGSIRADLIARGIDGGKIDVAPNTFTDLSRCKVDPNKKKWITFVGRFEALKNPLLLAEAIPLVIATHPEVQFHFIGSGGEEKKLRTFVDEQGLNSHVSIYFDPLPTRTLARSAIFVSLQEEENYPSQSLLEAMACGNAIVATDAGETWRLVDETNGIRVQPTAEAIAKAITTILDSPNLGKLQKASHQRILNTHTAERYFDYIAGVYHHAEN